VVYIGPKTHDPLVLPYDDDKDLKIACRHDRYFKRILTAEEYYVSGLPRFENLDI
jgi:hypothetical protein